MAQNWDLGVTQKLSTHPHLYGGVSLRFKLGSIEGSKKSGFGLYVTPPKRLRIFEFLVRDQEVGGSNPLAPTTSNSRSHIDLLCNCFCDFHFQVGGR